MTTDIKRVVSHLFTVHVTVRHVSYLLYWRRVFGKTDSPLLWEFNALFTVFLSKTCSSLKKLLKLLTRDWNSQEFFFSQSRGKLNTKMCRQGIYWSPRCAWDNYANFWCNYAVSVNRQGKPWTECWCEPGFSLKISSDATLRGRFQNWLHCLKSISRSRSQAQYPESLLQTWGGCMFSLYYASRKMWNVDVSVTKIKFFVEEKCNTRNYGKPSKNGF